MAPRAREAWRLRAFRAEVGIWRDLKTIHKKWHWDMSHGWPITEKDFKKDADVMGIRTLEHIKSALTTDTGLVYTHLRHPMIQYSSTQMVRYVNTTLKRRSNIALMTKLESWEKFPSMAFGKDAKILFRHHGIWYRSNFQHTLRSMAGHRFDSMINYRLMILLPRGHEQELARPFRNWVAGHDGVNTQRVLQRSLFAKIPAPLKQIILELVRDSEFFLRLDLAPPRILQ